MDKRNKKIEDFFNKSLEQFSDAPSDRVWAGIAQQLEADKPPFYKRWKFWFNTFMAIATLFLLSWGYFSMQQSIDLLMIKTGQLAQENEQLQLALNDCSTISKTDISKNGSNNTFNNSNQTASSTLIEESDNQIVESKYFSKSTFFAPSFFRGVDNSTFSNFGKKEGLFSGNRFRKGLNLFSPKDDFFQRIVLPIEITIADEVTRDEIVTDFSDSSIKNDVEIPLSEEAIAAIKESGFHHLTKLGNKRIGARRIKTSFRRSLPSTFIDYEPHHLTQPIRTKLDYRFGITSGWMNTFTDKKDLFGPGYNIGFTNELKLFNRVYLTGAINFVQQNYEIKLDASNQDILQTYPGVDELTNVVTSINHHVHILEFPIGLKWNFKENEKGTTFYVNPAVAWHFYFPQKFVYEQATNTGIIPFGQTNEQYFGYFGTMQIQLGMERPLFKKLNYQIGFWAEKSLIPLGIENRSLFNAGVRGAILLDK